MTYHLLQQKEMKLGSLFLCYYWNPLSLKPRYPHIQHKLMIFRRYRTILEKNQVTKHVLHNYHIHAFHNDDSEITCPLFPEVICIAYTMGGLEPI